MTRVTIENVTKMFGSHVAVDSLSLAIEPGELFFLLGPSGCGKTTLLRMLAGFLKPDTGAIRFNDKEVTSIPTEQRNTALVFQQYALWPHLSVFENVAYGLRTRKLSENEIRTRTMDALAQVRMDSFAERKPTSLSGGQQQRVALARALVVKPDLLLFDEPLSNLDAKLRLEMREEIRALHREHPITAVYVTHDQEEAMSLSGRMSLMNEGKIVQTGTASEIYNHPCNRFAATFMGDLNILTNESALGKKLGATADQDIAIRPERVQIATKGSFTGGIASCTFMGSHSLILLVASDGTELAVRTEDLMEVGTTVAFELPEKHLLRLSK